MTIWKHFLKSFVFTFREFWSKVGRIVKKTIRIENKRIQIKILRESLSKTGPLRFGSENQFPLNFAHGYILVQK